MKHASCTSCCRLHLARSSNREPRNIVADRPLLQSKGCKLLKPHNAICCTHLDACMRAGTDPDRLFRLLRFAAVHGLLSMRSVSKRLPREGCRTKDCSWTPEATLFSNNKLSSLLRDDHPQSQRHMVIDLLPCNMVPQLYCRNVFGMSATMGSCRCPSKRPRSCVFVCSFCMLAAMCADIHPVHSRICKVGSEMRMSFWPSGASTASICSFVLPWQP